MKKLLVLFILFLINFKALGIEKVVSVVSEIDYAPYVFVENNKSITGTTLTLNQNELVKGYSWEVFRESFHIMGYSIKYMIVPWARALKLLEHGRVQLLFPLSKSKERLQLFDYSTEPINVVDYVMYSSKGSRFKWNGYDSLNNEVIGVKRDFNYGDKWNSLHYANAYNIRNILEGFEMLEKDHIDAFFGYQENWDYILKQNGWEDRFKKTTIIDSTLEYVASLKEIEENSKLLDVFDEGKRKLIENGTLEKIKRKWFDFKKVKPND